MTRLRSEAESSTAGRPWAMLRALLFYAASAVVCPGYLTMVFTVDNFPERFVGGHPLLWLIASFVAGIGLSGLGIRSAVRWAPGTTEGRVLIGIGVAQLAVELLTTGLFIGALLYILSMGPWFPD